MPTVTSNAASAKISISLQEINLYFKQNASTYHALKDINLDVYNEDFICLLGPSGCGKTSLLNIIAGYETPSSGKIYVGEKEFHKPTPDVGIVFQQPNLFPWLTVRKNIEFGLKFKNISSLERKEIVDYYLDVVGLAKFDQVLPHQLSGGMRQRAAIARTLATNPKIVLLDEPFSALDALTREKMQLHIYDIWKKAKKSFFFITHDVDEALLLSNRILVMHSNPGEIISDFQNPLDKSHPNFFKTARETKEFWNLRESLIKEIEQEDDTSITLAIK